MAGSGLLTDGSGDVGWGVEPLQGKREEGSGRRRRAVRKDRLRASPISVSYLSLRLGGHGARRSGPVGSAFSIGQHALPPEQRVR